MKEPLNVCSGEEAVKLQKIPIYKTSHSQAFFAVLRGLLISTDNKQETLQKPNV